MGEPQWLFANTGDAACAIDKNQRIVHWNSAAEELLGYNAVEVLGLRCWQLFRGYTPGGEPFCRSDCPIVQRALRGEAIRHFNLIVQGQEGRLLLMNISNIPIPEQYCGQRAALVMLLRLMRQEPAPPERLCLFLLGPTRVRRPDGSFVDGVLWQRGKVRALLVYLAWQQGRPVPRKELLQLLWPDMPYDAALSNLNTTVYNLRRSLEPALEHGGDSYYIGYDGGCYCLTAGAELWLDVEAFERNVRLARKESDRYQAVHRYQEALVLYQGDYLQDLSATGIWQRSEQNRLHQMYLEAMEELAILYEQAGQKEEAGELYNRILEIDPERDSVRHRLASLSWEHSDRATALLHCRGLAESLKQELDLMLGQEELLRSGQMNRPQENGRLEPQEQDHVSKKGAGDPGRDNGQPGS
jgi:PAS domain S-box-containing protein